MNRTRLVSLGLVLSCGCGSVDGLPVDKQLAELTSATSATSCQWPSVVDLGCTGVLLNPRLVLTAAHCLQSGAGPISEIHLGEDARAPARTVAVSSCVAHPQFDGETSEYDLGGCLLAEPIDDVPLVPIIAPCQAQTIEQGAPVTLVGFGTTAADAVDTLGVKRILQSTIGATLTPNTLLIGSRQATGCHGDSGSPAFVRAPDGTMRAFALLSAGYELECESPGVYLRLAPFIPWLEKTFKVDVSPCFADDGAYEGGADCVAFPSQPDHSGPDWSLGCSETAAAPAGACPTAPSDGGSAGQDATSSAAGVVANAASGSGGAAESDDGGSPTTISDAGVPASHPSATSGCSLSAEHGSSSWFVTMFSAWLVVSGLRRRQRARAR